MEGRTRNPARDLPHKTDAKVRGTWYYPPSEEPGLKIRDCRVTSTIYSGDARYVLTGSDDGNVRIWKAKASEKLGIITARERAALEYRESLKERWKMDSEVGKVMRCVVCNLQFCFETI